MQRFMISLVGAALVCQLTPADGGPYACKFEGLHLCCKGCEKVVQDVLGGVKGVSGTACDRTTKVVTFKAKNDKAADEAVGALANAGFHFTVTIGDKSFPLTTNPTGLKGDEITIRNVHACCPDCEKAIEGLFKEAKVTFVRQGPQKDVTIISKGLDADEVLQKLQKAGFQGVIAEKKKKP
jgi:mercuric ion binding protein